MRIKVINPNTDEQMTESIRVTAERCCEKGTEIIAVHSPIGPQSIENYFDEYLAIPGVLQEIIKGDKEEDIDAYVIACFDDPGVPAAREITDKPVIGIAEAAMATMRFIAPSFSIITVLDRSKHMNEKLARELGYSEVLRSVRSTGMSVLDFGKNHAQGLPFEERMGNPGLGNGLEAVGQVQQGLKLFGRQIADADQMFHLGYDLLQDRLQINDQGRDGFFGQDQWR